MIEYEIYANMFNTSFSTMTSTTGSNTTFQLADASGGMDATSCTPNIEKYNIRSKQQILHIPILRVMNSKNSFGCFMDNSMAIVSVGDKGNLANKFYFEDASTGKIILNN